MTYYLETNAIRILSNKLPQFVSNSFTSAFAIVELIGGLRNEFHLRKKVVENIFNSRLDIQWELPEYVIANSFSVVEFEEMRVPDLKKLCKILVQSEHLIDFEENCKDQNLIYDLGYFENYKEHLLKHFIVSTQEGNAKIQKIFDEWNPALFDSPNEYYSFKKKPVLGIFHNEAAFLNRHITIFGLAKGYADSMYGTSVTKEHYLEVTKSYNESVCYFIDAFSFYAIEKMINGGQPSRNDFADLSHLVYLRNNDSVQLLTDDKLLLDINDKLWNGSDRVRPATSV